MADYQDVLRRLTTRLTTRRWAIGIIAVGAALRLALGLSTLLHPSAALSFIQGDGFMEAGTYLLRHGDIPDPVFVPGYIYLCAFLQRISPSHAVFALLLLQWLLATLCIPLAMYLGQRFGGPFCEVLVGVCVALDPLLLIQSSLILTEAIYIPLLLVAVTLFFAALAPQRSGKRALGLLALCGAAIGICTLVRSVGLFVIPVMLLAIVLWHTRPFAFRAAAGTAFLVPALVLLLPLSLHNQEKYGHFNISSSGKFNFAALIVGPTKKSFDGNTSPELLDMWKGELGPDYRRKPPFVLADDASRVASAWAEKHPVLTLAGVLKGQAMMMVAPERTSWAAGLACLNLPRPALAGVDLLISLFRLAVAITVLIGVCRSRRLFREPEFLLFFGLLILVHMAGAGAAGAGRFVAPVVPYLDLLASLTLVQFTSLRHASEESATSPLLQGRSDRG